MKALSFLFVLWCAVLPAYGHEYYFGFAEMQYNETNRTLETTVVLSAHDLENVLRREGKIAKDLEFLQEDSATLAVIEKKITADFSVSVNGKPAVFRSLGFEIQRNGLVNVYLLAEEVAPPETLDITFACLMEEFPEQQNKITYISNTRKYTAVFLPQQRSAVIQISK